MKFLLSAVVLLQGAAAYPSLNPKLLNQQAEKRQQATPGCSVSSACDTPMTVTNQQIGYNPEAPTALQQVSAGRQNCGFLTTCTTFDATEQYISTTGQYAYQSPTAEDIRGPCPGLNAAANHGYLPRSGILSILATTTGLSQAYGFSSNFAAALAAFSIAIAGNILNEAWSIGGPPPSNGISNPVLGPGQGISYSHSKYEGDGSIGRCDAYTNGGDAHSLSLTRFTYAYESDLTDGSYTMDGFSRAYAMNTHRSIAQNANYFAPLLAVTVVSPAAYNFVIAFMSNHSAEKPGGFLTPEVFKSFFAITGEPGSFEWMPGQERIPDNWYRRPSSSPYSAVAGLAGDLIPEWAAYTDTFRLGGNTNGVNTYQGVELGNYTNGAYNMESLFQGNNAQCLIYQSFQQATLDTITTSKFLQPFLDAAFGTIANCPSLEKFNDNNFENYQGHSYSPTGPGTNC